MSRAVEPPHLREDGDGKLPALDDLPRVPRPPPRPALPPPADGASFNPAANLSAVSPPLSPSRVPPPWERACQNKAMDALAGEWGLATGGAECFRCCDLQ
jgi:hypothetical protein